jgi:hypothetical protein
MGHLCRQELADFSEKEINLPPTPAVGCGLKITKEKNYTDRATASCRRSDCQLLRIEGATLSA